MLHLRGRGRETEKGMERQVDMIMFLENLAIVGGLVPVASFGPGPISFDARGKRP